jgi:GNAT superfamily N-acetyltransferase
MKDLKQFIKTTLQEFLNENNIYTRNGYKFTKIYNDGDFDYELVQNSSNEIIGIEVYYNRKLIGSINIGLLDDEWLNDYSDNEYYKIINKNPFIHNVSIIDEFQNKGIATKLYELLFKYLKKDGYNIVYSGKTRNSMFVNNLWKRFGDGFEIIKDNTFGGKKKIYYKNL